MSFIIRDTQKQYENEFKMQPDLKNIASKTSNKIEEKKKDVEVKTKLTKASNVTEKGTNQTKQEPKDINNKKVRELELVELFRASLDQNVDCIMIMIYCTLYMKVIHFREQVWSMQLS